MKILFLGFVTIAATALFTTSCETVRTNRVLEIDQSSPKSVVAAYRKATNDLDWPTILECMEPAMRPEFDRMLFWYKAFLENASVLETSVRNRFRDELADWFHTEIVDPYDRMAKGVFFLPDRNENTYHVPVQFMQKNQNIAVIRINGRDTRYAVKKCGENWYITETNHCSSCFCWPRSHNGLFSQGLWNATPPPSPLPPTRPNRLRQWDESV